MNDDQIINGCFYGTEMYGTAHKIIKTVQLYLGVMMFMKYDCMPEFSKSSDCRNMSLLVNVLLLVKFFEKNEK